MGRNRQPENGTKAWVSAGLTGQLRFLLLLFTTVLSLATVAPHDAQAQTVTATCPAISQSDLAVFRPDANTCVINGADTNPNLLIGNNLDGAAFYPGSTILLSAQPGTGLSTPYYNAGAGDIAVPLGEFVTPVGVPCASNAACNVTLFFTFDGTEYSIDIATSSGSNVINATSAPSVVPPADATPPRSHRFRAKPQPLQRHQPTHWCSALCSRKMCKTSPRLILMPVGPQATPPPFHPSTLPHMM